MISSYFFICFTLLFPFLSFHFLVNSVTRAFASPNGYPQRLTSQPFSLDQRQSGSGSKLKYRIGPPLVKQKEEDRNQDELMDVVLLATVDGKFHALNRSNGALIWSMHDEKMGYLTDPSNLLMPLVQTESPPPETAREDDEEFYIVEPQSGAIYVLPPSSSPETPISKLPYTVPKLVEQGPFVFPEDESKMFVGSKRTSLIVLDLETGQIRGVVDTETECAWDMFPVSKGNQTGAERDSELDLDDLDGTRTKPKEVYIGRTEYRLKIHTRPSPNNPFAKRKTQNLQFTSYHPNTFHSTTQANYKSSADGAYIQGLTGGTVLAFVINEKDSMDPTLTADAKASFKWAIHMSENIAATFDLFNEDNPYALLQPAPTISQVFAAAPQSANSDLLLRGEVGYVGLIGESLYVLGSEAYPLVFFSDERPDLKFIDGGERSPTEGHPDGPPEESDYFCKTLSCLVGLKTRKDGSWGEAIGRLGIDPPSGTGTVIPNTESPRHEPVFENATRVPRPEPTGRAVLGNSIGGQWFKIVATVFTAMLVGVAGVLWSKSQSSASVSLVAPLIADAPAINESPVATKRVRFEDETTDDVIEIPALAVIDRTDERVIESDETSPSHITSTDLTDTGPPEPEVPVIPVKVAEPIFVPPPETPIVGSTSSGIPELVIIPATPSTPATPTPTLNKSETDSIPTSDSSQSVGVVSASSTATSMTSLENEGEDDDADPDFVMVEGQPLDPPDTPGTEEKKKKNRMRSKSRKKKAAKEAAKEAADVKIDSKDVESAKAVVEKVDIQIESEKRMEPVKETSLIVSEEILGFGSHGTVVFKGAFQGRAVAVKRLLHDFVTLAAREVTLLQESDEHPNVIRYYFMEARQNFLYIALELCPASLADVVERPDNPKFSEISCSFDPKRALMQITSGLRWLHGLKIIHRDIKPQNILIAYSKSNLRLGAASRSTKGSQHRLLISDFGLCKKLGADETSFVPTVHGAMAAGTVGWRAPEILRGEVKVDETSIPADDNSQSSRGSVANGTSPGSSSSSRTRLTKSVDVFALGCLFYYTLTSGSHPYGDRYERDINIMKDNKDLSGLQSFGEEGAEAVDLITNMLSPESSQRPDTTTVLLHPFFWTPARRLTFLQDASDRFEIMHRDPPEAPLVMLETGAQLVVGNDWHTRLDRTFIDNLGKFRKYDGRSVQDLMRALRNKKHHYQDLPENVKRNLGPLPEGFLMYFTQRFPALFLHVYYVVQSCGLAQESMFQSYFELVDV